MTTIRSALTAAAALAVGLLPLSAFADACARAAHAATVHPGGSTAIQWLTPACVAVVAALAYRASRRR